MAAADQAAATPEPTASADGAPAVPGAADTEMAAASAAPEAPGRASGIEAPEVAGDLRRPGQQPWWRPKPFSRPLWYPVAGAVAVLALLAGGAMTLLTISGLRARPLAADCGLVTCGASLPPVVTGPAVPSTATHSIARPHRRHRAARRRELAPAAHSRPRPSALPGRPAHRRRPRAPRPGGPAPAAVTVTYTLDGTDPWHQDFRAHLTIVNHGATPVAGWTVQVSLPGDQVDWVGYPGAWNPFANWQFSGGTLDLNAVSGGETLAPGATEIVPISAQGSNTVPGGCQFNGAACQP
jgi:cellulose binding protein with CBM2 domain